ncbi:hypothetical protein [Cupriavidus necator]|uniref:hypothetical protein n=1 Tax=Cupriavidus necator TaxID=106590 RepID=UPI0003A145A3|nr:hypothetical protein [Cupriavidus necator]
MCRIERSGAARSASAASRDLQRLVGFAPGGSVDGPAGPVQALDHFFTIEVRAGA